MRPDVW